MKIPWSISTIGISGVLFCTLIAELYRFHGFLLLDFLTPLFVGAWLLHQVIQKKQIHWPRTLWPAVFFFFIGLSSLFLHSQGMSTGEVLSASFYGIRWVSFYFLSIIVFNQNAREKTHTLWMLFGLSLALCVAGFIQLDVMPDFTSMELLGWDPHQGRLLSTWFDPNFVGGFLAFILPLIVGSAWEQKKWRKSLIPLALMITVGLALTLSRSAYLALMTGLFVFGLLRSIKWVAALGVGLLLLITVLSPVQARFLSLVENVKSVFVEDYTLPDASARLRFASWSEAWELFLEEPLLGQGYNRYKYAALDLGTLKDLHLHSASGSDSSLLNILAMTGLLGFVPFFSLYLILAHEAWKQRTSGYGAGFLSALCGLFVHCIFVNSLLFPLFMAPFWVAAGLLKTESPSSAQ